MTPLNKMEQLESTLQALFESLQWTGNTEAIELANEALLQLAELMAQERLLSAIF